MAIANIVRTWQDATNAYMTVSVAEDPNNPATLTNYTGSVVKDAAWAADTLAQKKAALVAACQAVRNAALPPAPPPDLGLTGQVTV